MVQLIENQPNRVVQLFNNKTVFITGGTGFLGKVLIEKLLRACSGVKKIYVLIRPKRGKEASERLETIFEDALFDLVKQQQGKSVLAKVEAINGDVSAPDLGLSKIDRQKLIEEVQIIYHSAATVRFDEVFKTAVFINVRGAKLMLALAKECKNLLVHCHLSTAYCHEDQEVLLEKTYPAPADPDRVIDMCEWLDEATLEIISNRIRGSSANTYTFTKKLGEALVDAQMDNLPIILQRPSAVIPIWKEPIPGWTDNINGPTGLLIGAGKGVIRTMYGHGDNFADYVPVDIIANGLICTVYDYLTHKTRRVYNMTSTDEHKVTFTEILEMGRKVITEYPFNWVLWYPGGGMQTSRALHYLYFLLFQLIPAFFVDALLIMFGFRPVLVKVQKRIWRGYDIFEHYTNRKWNFNKSNSAYVRKVLNKKEKEVFMIEAHNVDYYQYFAECAKGARRFILKESEKQLPAARRRMKVMWFVDKFCKTMIIFGFFYLLYNKIFLPLLLNK